VRAESATQRQAPVQRGRLPVVVLVEVQPQSREVPGNQGSNHRLSVPDLLVRGEILRSLDSRRRLRASAPSASRISRAWARMASAGISGLAIAASCKPQPRRKLQDSAIFGQPVFLWATRTAEGGTTGSAPVKLAATALTSKTRVSDHVPLEIPDATLHDRKALQSARGMICIGAIDSLR
jgi:hypothetical protein